jgi:glycosyltransferase involved in cell wall biosynthesis
LTPKPDRSKRVALSLISGDEWKADEIKRLLESVEPHVHGIYVNYNGKKRPHWGNWTSVPITYRRTTWEDDFAAARNVSYEMIPKKDYGWWMWLDTDDVLVAPDGLGPLIDDPDPYTRGFFTRYAYAIDPETGACMVEQWRERLMSLDWVWSWRYPIHEVCHAPAGTQFSWADGEDSSKIYVEHLRKNKEDRGTRERNRRIVMKALRQEPDNPRYHYYWANECLAEAEGENDPSQKALLCDAAIVQYRHYLDMGGGAPDDDYAVAIRISELFGMKGDHRGALDAFMQAARDTPDWPEAWVGAAESCLRLGDFKRVRDFANIALNARRGHTAAAVMPMSYGFTPLVLRGIGNEEMGNFKEALADYRAAKKLFDHPDHSIDERIAGVKHKMKLPSQGDAQKERMRRRGWKPEKSIAFYTNPISETWNQKTLREGGHGGSETLVLELAPRFAADGWRVAVFGCPGDARGIGDDGVEYWESEDFQPMEPFSVLISSRSPIPFAGPLLAKHKYLWMHDVNIGPILREVAGRPDKIVPISQWHRQHLSRLYGIPDDQMVVIPNGVDLSMYPLPEFTDGMKFIWSSSPDRGLDTVLQLWPWIKSTWPEATLDVFYGWDFIDKVIASNPGSHLEWLKDRIARLWLGAGAEEAGLFWHGRVPPAVLAKAQQQAEVWLYPTDFMETFCLTAVQAQLCGAIPITTNLAALSENVACDYLKLNGWPQNNDFQGRMMDLMLDLFADNESAADLRLRTREIGRAFAENFSIDAAYDAWNCLFISEGVKVT